MRPRRIEISGFTCFSKPVTVSFEGMDVFAITGRTGSGKTTIMDAMCYALYGKVPRGTDVSRLVAHDAQKMYVSFEFEAGGRNYRALRTIGLNRTTLKATPTTVQFEREIAEDEWEPLENRVREMNEAVERTIGLDYRAFTRCVLLPQGRFQEMLSGEAADRRAVLEDLLDIGVYERIMREANRRAREIDAQAKAIEHVLSSTFVDATEEALAERTNELTEARPSLKTAHQQRDALQQATQHASDVVSAREAERRRRKDADEKTKELAAAEKLSQDGESQLKHLRADTAAAEAALKDLPYDRELHTMLGAARSAAAHVERVAADEASAKTAAADRSIVTKAEGMVKDADAGAQKAKAALVAADAALDGARREHAAAHLRAGLKAGDTCPVCAGTVGKLAKTAPPALASMEKAQATAKKSDEQAVKQVNAANQAFALARRDAEQAAALAEKAGRDLAQARNELTAQLPRGFAPELKAIASRLDELQKLGTRLDELTAQGARLRAQRDEHEQAMRDSREKIERLRGEAKTLTDAADGDRTRGDEAMALLTAIVKRWKWGDVDELIASKRDPSAVLATMLRATQDECAKLERRIGALEEETKRIERDIKQAQAQRAELAGLRAQGGLYATLADLLQANRFRDWYIGEAMTLLAEAASERLQTLDTDQRYALQVHEGEFIVVDRWQANATRSPETLSGGETFVVSLALALALAERLPQIQSATAAALESLFLDEGFGTLDADTLDPVMNALEGLRLEGRLVGIVTHVRELAERIGTRIEVTKAPEGSTVVVVSAAAA